MTDVTNLSPLKLSTAQLARLRDAIASGVMVVSPGISGTKTHPTDPPRQVDSESFWWEIEGDGSTEDWNRWDRHQMLEYSFLVREDVRMGALLQAWSVKALACPVFLYMSVFWSSGPGGILASPESSVGLELAEAVGKKVSLLLSSTGCLGGLPGFNAALNDITQTAINSLLGNELERLRNEPWAEY
jgi:hypothetical protein